MKSAAANYSCHRCKPLRTSAPVVSEQVAAGNQLRFIALARVSTSFLHCMKHTDEE